MDSIDQLANDLDDSKVLLTIEEDDWNGVCHPDIGSQNLTGGSKHGAPFNFRTSGDPPSPNVVGERFKQEFHECVDKVWEMIDDKDDPLDAIMDLDPEDMPLTPALDEEK